MPDSWRIIIGDVIEMLQAIPGASIDLIFADPPYNIGIDYGNGKKADSLSDVDYLAWCRIWLGQCVRVLRPGGTMWALINDEYAAEYCVMMKGLGLTMRSWVKWYETFGVNCSKKFNRTSRHLLYFVKGKRFTFNREAVSRPSDRQTKYNDPRAKAGGKIWDDVWTIPRLCGTFNERLPEFPTQLPMALLRPIVLSTSNPGDMILDPFNGSGTTGAVALESNRRYIGIELNDKWANASMERLARIERRSDER